MSKKAWYWIAGIVIIVVVVIVVATSSGGQPAGSSAQAPSDQNTVASGVRQSMHDLIASGATQTCTFSIPATTATSSSMSGTIYMASGSMKGDFVTTNSSGKTTDSHMIIASSTVYLWADAMARGVKVPWALASSSTALLNKSGGVDIDQPASYSCTNAVPDPSEFIVPADTHFSDISALIRK
jgi:hypothetical protein